MSMILRAALLLFSVLTLLYFLNVIRKSKVQIEDAVFWIVVSIFWILLSLFPQILTFFAKLMGVQSPVNFLYLVMLFILIIKNFSLTIKVSMLQAKLYSLGENYAIEKNIEKDKSKAGNEL